MGLHSVACGGGILCFRTFAIGTFSREGMPHWPFFFATQFEIDQISNSRKECCVQRLGCCGLPGHSPHLFPPTLTNKSPQANRPSSGTELLQLPALQAHDMFTKATHSTAHITRRSRVSAYLVPIWDCANNREPIIARICQRRGPLIAPSTCTLRTYPKGRRTLSVAQDTRQLHRSCLHQTRPLPQSISNRTWQQH